MKDRYGRNIDYMRISITDRCNLRCRYCMPDGIAALPETELLTYEEIRDVCRAAVRVGICNIKLTGGEPLMREGCAGLVGMLKGLPGIRQVTITTNGILLPRYLPALLKNGIDAVNISLDTLSEQTYKQITGAPQLPRVLEGIRLALEAGLAVKLNCVLLKGVNDSEWQALAALTKTMPIDVRFIEMMPIGYGRNFAAVSNEMLLKELYRMYPELEADRRIHGNGPAVYYRIKGAQGSIGLISAVHGKFCRQCNRLRLTAAGQLKPCLCYADSVDVRSILRGSVREEETGRISSVSTKEEGKREASLYHAFQEALEHKPRMHQFEVPGAVTEQGQMVQIGG